MAGGLLLAATLVSGCMPQPASGFDLDGRRCDPVAECTGDATVLIFVSDDCPIANRYVPEILRLRDAYAGRGVSFWLVHSDPRETVPLIREHAREFHLTIPEARDPSHYLARLSEAEVTPSAAVFTRDGRLVYHGRIDDRVADLQRERPTPTRRDLAEALDAVLAGREVPNAVTPAVGCSIPGL
jgi:hypothetical protein